MIKNNFLYYKSTLNVSLGKIYKLIFEKLNSCGNTVKFQITHANELSKIFEAILLDNPLIFFVKSYQYSSDLYKGEMIFKPIYHLTVKEIKQFQLDIKSSLARFEAIKQLDDYEKVLFVHDFILNNIKYDYTFSEYSPTILGIVESKMGVCEGISKYVKLALDFLSVKSIVVTGQAINPAYGQTSNEPHAWNLVEIDGEWFHMDATFDLTLKHNENRYDYFCISDKYIMKDHNIISSVPNCSTEDYDYYTLCGSIFESLGSVENMLYTKLRSGNNSVQFRLKNMLFNTQLTDSVIKLAQKQASRIFTGGVSIEMRYNPSLLVFEIDFRQN